VTRSIALPSFLSAVDCFERIRHLPGAWLLESGKPQSERGRFDIIVADPLLELTFKDQVLSLRQGKILTTLHETPFDALNRLYKEHLPKKVTDSKLDEVPFISGFLGQFGYDLGRTVERLPSLALSELSVPDMHIGLYTWSVVIDHALKTTTLYADDQITDNQLTDLTALFNCESFLSESKPFKLKSAFQPNVTEAEYHQKLGAIHEYILAGDCYQVNFAQRFDAPFEGDPWTAYKQLREKAPTPFSAYCDTEHGALLSLSPERFIRCNHDGVVVTQPIKGTRPRGATADEDIALAQELAHSEKDQAENVMIVDLLRNDISRNCKAGSVVVPKLFDIESYKNVHHLVSTIEGKLENNRTPVELLRDAFPGGSITGAPKIRAMEIIEELEPHRRHTYCGSIGYIDLRGNMDTSITIRTLIADHDHLYCWAGGGIVADSQSDQEYKETFDKVNNLLKTLESLS
jgi:para-aminobenzoate synthetase component 1